MKTTVRVFGVKIGNKFLNDGILVNAQNEAYQYMDEQDAADAASEYISFNDTRLKEMRPEVISFDIEL